MIKKLLTIITASFMLAAPCLNAGLDSWISSILPEPMRASQSTRDHFYAAKSIMGIKRPAIITNALLGENMQGSTINSGFFSHVQINEFYINEYAPEEHISTIYHEAGHVYHNHHAVSNGLLTAGQTGYAITLGAYLRCLPRHLGKRFGIASILSYAGHMCIDSEYLNSEARLLQKTRTRELQADVKAAQAMNQAGHTDILQARLQSLQEQLSNESCETQPRGPKYPTLGEEIAYLKTALKQV